MPKKETENRKTAVSFNEDELKFLKESKLARLATVSPSGQPHVVPIGFEFDGKFFHFGGYYITKSLSRGQVLVCKRMKFNFIKLSGKLTTFLLFSARAIRALRFV